MKTPYIVLDYDEMLAHSMCPSSEKHADELLYDFTEHWVGQKFELHDGWYVTFKRSWAQDLIEFANSLVGKNNVFILTTGRLDYIQTCNRVLKLGFDPNTNIFGREDILRVKTHPKFKESFNILVDNESYEFHTLGENCKVNFLNRLPRTQYVKVKRFSLYTDPLEYDVEYFVYLQNKITQVLTLIN
jgi:hypothetical protein